MQLPPDDINADISPKEFELLVKEFLEGTGKELKNFKVIHDPKKCSYVLLRKCVVPFLDTFR
jgi:hypothetical protein